MLETIRNALWEMPLIGLLLSFGGYFTVKTRFIPLRLPWILKRTVGSLFGKKDKKALLRAVSTALGGTVGIGSITGVAYGIAAGGAGRGTCPICHQYRKKESRRLRVPVNAVGSRSTWTPE